MICCQWVVDVRPGGRGPHAGACYSKIKMSLMLFADGHAEIHQCEHHKNERLHEGDE